ncbi:MAG: exodeoxyribonuclease VII large subunit [Clostridia bacterium]
MNEQVLTVTQLNTFVKDYIEALPPLRSICVKGEVSNLTKHKTGHYYFTLKDDGALIKSVMFRSDAEKVAFDVQNGQKILVRGHISVFVRDGTYQLYAETIELDGIGSLYIAFEQLKEKLRIEGLFDERHKMPLPTAPFSIGIVTAPTGAAIRDMLNISKRRFPLCEITLYPALVQGKGAAAQIKKGIEYFNRTKSVQLIVIGRGGGSIEDLWAFNDEKLAHAVYDSLIPIISAVGHETDFTITDFVADLRAPTPSAAMELALPDKLELIRKFGNVNKHNAQSLQRRLQNERRVLDLLSSSYVLTQPKRMFEDKKMTILSFEEQLVKYTKNIITQKKVEIKSNKSLLASYNPLGVLKRGYAIAYDKNGSVIKSKKQIEIGEKFSVSVSDGKINAERKK